MIQILLLVKSNVRGLGFSLVVNCKNSEPRYISEKSKLRIHMKNVFFSKLGFWKRCARYLGIYSTDYCEITVKLRIFSVTLTRDCRSNIFLILNDFEKYKQKKKRRNFWHKFDTSKTNSCYSHNFHRNENP